MWLSVELASEMKMISNMDKYCIILVHNVLQEKRHMLILVGLIVFFQQNFKENSVFQA